MSSKTKIVFTGATGYIGGAVLARLLKHPDFNTWEITAIVRSPEKAKKLEKHGIKVVVGSHDDASIVEPLVAASDVVIATADADNVEACRASLAGLKKSYQRTGVPPTFIHTSGTGVLADNAAGEYSTDLIYDDANVDQIESLSPTQLHRNVDLMIVDADREGYTKTYIILPCTIYGIADNVLVDEGIANGHSIQVPALIRAAVVRGRAGTVGKGENLWPNVNVEDIADLYIVLFDSIRKNPGDTGHGREGFYFGENGEHSLYEVGKAIGQALVDLERATEAEPTIFSKEEIDKYFNGSNYLGSNSRCRSNRSRAIGWKPTRTKGDFLASIKPEVEALIRKRGNNWMTGGNIKL